ncbi:MAG: hypothetical protein Q7T04_04905 [Dehalococcoidia bacterium]|nr:hypothetical protein [Dehalococcoidia bacterium]
MSARARGYQAIGCDTDPLALLIARGWCSDVNPAKLKRLAKLVLDEATALNNNTLPGDAYPSNMDLETRKFLDYWFDETNRCQLTALSNSISTLDESGEKTLLWCAFSRLIITKKSGVSLAMDVSHSRPHKKYEKAPVQPFDKFLRAVDYVTQKAPFGQSSSAPTAIIRQADARSLPFDSQSIDVVITSPPYLNAIDYIRGHKFTLVWMGHSISELRSLRSSNIGSERSGDLREAGQFSEVVERMVNVELDHKHFQLVMKYILDMNRVISECRRVLTKNGQAVFVIGDSNVGGVFVKNSEGLISLATRNGFALLGKVTRPLPVNRRYLPPPNLEKSGNSLQSRMREEVILSFV